MWKGNIFSNWNGEQFVSICQITDMFETKVVFIQVSTDLNCTEVLLEGTYVLLEARRRWYWANLCNVISMFPVMWRTMIYVFLAFFPCWNKTLDCRQMKAEVRINLLQTRFNWKWTFNLLAHFVQIDKFLLNCIYPIVPVLDLLNLRTAVFRQHQK